MHEWASLQFSNTINKCLLTGTVSASTQLSTTKNWLLGNTTIENLKTLKLLLLSTTIIIIIIKLNQ